MAFTQIVCLSGLDRQQLNQKLFGRSLRSWPRAQDWLRQNSGPKLSGVLCTVKKTLNSQNCLFSILVAIKGRRIDAGEIPDLSADIIPAASQ